MLGSSVGEALRNQGGAVPGQCRGVLGWGYMRQGSAINGRNIRAQQSIGPPLADIIHIICRRGRVCAAAIALVNLIIGNLIQFLHVN